MQQQQQQQQQQNRVSWKHMDDDGHGEDSERAIDADNLNDEYIGRNSTKSNIHSNSNSNKNNYSNYNSDTNSNRNPFNTNNNDDGSKKQQQFIPMRPSDRVASANPQQRTTTMTDADVDNDSDLGIVQDDDGEASLDAF